MLHTTDFKKLTLNKFKLAFFFLKKMPLAFVSGMRVTQFDDNYASVSIPYNYFTKNPFGSVYFAVQSMAAELSSGVIAINEVMKASAPVSMLIFNMDAQFTKKARSKILFTCNDGKAIAQAIGKAIQEGVGQTVTITSTGVDSQGDIVSTFHFTWTFKTKNLKT